MDSAMRHTKKFVAAQQMVKQLSAGKALIPYGAKQDDYYALLERAGYSWDSQSGKWARWETPPRAPSTLVVNVRLRAALGDVEQATKLVGEALESVGFKFLRVSPPDPDDRDGPATTARVYMQIQMPNDR